ncbi:hypothetical protein [Enterovirga aerilata]|uniref:Lipoprotein n=1 Tax=Enterovirga aerilata TaxID=2730920 RepID=A0A849IGK2_9HYPH|nr:hypothetical protein [Enterovirga sp. DB1703]NNM75077.1 hypothetical protein [Enterovirga sp. DB1703]
MIRAILAAGALSCALALGGCVTATAPTGPDIAAPVPPSRADAAVAKASGELVRYCGLTRMALTAVGIFASPKVQDAAAYAGAVVNTVCDQPPGDVRSALDTIGRAYSAVVTAQAAD